MDKKVCTSPYLNGGPTGTWLNMSSTLPMYIPETVTHTLSTASSLVDFNTTLPGVTMITEQGASYNTGPRPAYLRVLIARQGWLVTASNPNVTQIRDRFTYAIDAAPPPADVTDTYTSQFTAGLDLSTNKSAVPLPGVITRYSGASVHEELIGPVPPGGVVMYEYKVNAWTPPPFSTNANNNSPTTRATTLGGHIILMWMPGPDKE